MNELAEIVADALMGMRTTHKVPRILTIIIKGPNHFDVYEGELYHDRLCWDEMLGQVAQLTHPKISKARYTMDTVEGHCKWMEHAAQRSSRREAIAEDFGIEPDFEMPF